MNGTRNIIIALSFYIYKIKQKSLLKLGFETGQRFLGRL